jgi:Xaa-Pro dipeptidase
MNELLKHYPSHVAELQNRSKNALKRDNLQGFVIHSGQEIKVFLDDYSYPFKVNPHFKAWLPLIDLPNCWLIINGEDKPTLIYYQPVDFWHKVKVLEDSYWNEEFTIKVISDATDVGKLLPRNKKGYAYIGSNIEVANELGFKSINPESPLNYIHYHRAYKTHYEQECIRLANAIAVKGHKIAKASFLEGSSEFDIQQDYLKETELNYNETPYSNIIAINKNASILHYTEQDRGVPQAHKSFLIDAGANYNGYAADITRTYSFKRDKFAELITRMNTLMLNTVNGLKPGTSYVDLHIQTYKDIGNVLVEFDFINVTAEQAFESGIISTFFPHGLGHHLGLQTHDVGGFMSDESGSHVNPPKEHPFLRTSRIIEVNQVFTIEPGLYFIDCLLEELKASQYSKMVNWNNVDEMKVYGGIRIEDNIIVHSLYNENITRDLNL